MDKAEKARLDKLYAKLENAGLFNEVNTLIWQRVTNAARGAYAEGKDDGYELAMKKMAMDAQE